MTLPMSWNEWAQHDGVGLAARVRKGELTAKELARQAAAGVAKVNPALSGVVELFDDVIAEQKSVGDGLEGARVFRSWNEREVRRGAERDDDLVIG